MNTKQKAERWLMVDRYRPVSEVGEIITALLKEREALLGKNEVYPSLPCADKEISVAQVVERNGNNSYRLEWFMGKQSLLNGTILYAKTRHGIRHHPMRERT